jgi:hypothetical protein
MPDQPISDAPFTVNLANDLPGLIEAATVNLEDNWKPPFADQAPRQLPIVIGQAQATLALAIAQYRANTIAETANLIAFYNMSDEDAAGLISKGIMNRDKFEALAKNIAERLGL